MDVPTTAQPTDVGAALTDTTPTIQLPATTQLVATPPLTDPAEIAQYIRTHTGKNAPPLKDWHYCNCDVVTKVAPKKSNKVMRREADARKAKVEFALAEAERMGIPADNPILAAKIAELSYCPPRKEAPKTLDAPCDYHTRDRNKMRVHLRTIHTVYYCEYCRTRWNKPQKQKWKEHKQKYPSGQCRFPDTGGMGPGKSTDK